MKFCCPNLIDCKTGKIHQCLYFPNLGSRVVFGKSKLRDLLSPYVPVTGKDDRFEKIRFGGTLSRGVFGKFCARVKITEEGRGGAG